MKALFAEGVPPRANRASETMSVGENQTSPNEIDLEALRWLALMERARFLRKSRVRFAAWVAADIRHRGAIIRAQAASLRSTAWRRCGGRSVWSPLRTNGPPAKNTNSPKDDCRSHVGGRLVGIGAWVGREKIEEIWGGTRYASGVGELKKVVLRTDPWSR